MDWQWTPSAVVLLTTCGLSLGLANVLFTRRKIRGVSVLAVLMAMLGYYTLVSTFEAGAVDLSWKILFSKLEYVATGTIPILFFLFALRFTGHSAWLSRRRAFALLVLPIAAISLAATNELHGWIWSGFTPGPPGLNMVIYNHGPAFYVVIFAIYVYMLAGSALLVRFAIRSPTVQRRQSIMVLLAAAVPLICGILYAAGITPIPGLNLAPLSFAASGAVLGVGVVPLGLFRLLPAARERLIEGMVDAILVIDAHRRIVDVNPSARIIFELPQSIIGADAASLLDCWPQIESALNPDRETHVDATLSKDPAFYADIQLVPLRTAPSKLPGYLIVARDITKRRLAQNALEDANERLTEQLREIERLQAELRERAIRDPLTGLYNRRHLDEMFPRILERASMDGLPVSAILIDLDHFKNVNDRYGHRVGDALLEEIGRTLAERTRAEDIACRYGGEEFALILPHASLAVAIERTESLRAALRNLHVEGIAADEPPTLSAGIAVYPEHGTSQDALLRAADRALYRAKADGRDCIRPAFKASEPST